VADLHADSLLWERDLSKLSSYGHVDIPRLLQGNVALQTFTVVTKVPEPLLLEGNGDRSDNITKLAILQRWPIQSWFSLKKRALYQTKRLQALQQKASGQFRMIETKQDLNSYLAQRQQNSAITAGLLVRGGTSSRGKN
jgi:membrane dipeptidase